MRGVTFTHCSSHPHPNPHANQYQTYKIHEHRFEKARTKARKSEIHITVKFWRRSISNPVSFSPSKTISSPFAQYFTIHMIDSVLIRRCLLFISLCIFVSFLRFVLCAFLFLLQFDSRMPV